MSRNVNKMDTIKEWVQTHKTTLIQVAAVITIAIVVCAIMAPSKGDFTTEVERLDGGITTVGSTTSSLGTKVVAVEGATKANQQKLDAMAGTLEETTGTILGLDTRIELANEQIDAIGTEIEAVKAMVGSPPEARLTGTTGNYTLYAKSSKAGNFTTTIHLCYATPVVASNGTYQEALEAFYGSISWNATNVKAYIPTLSYNGTVWGVTRVSFSVGVITLEAKAEKATGVLFGGLPVTYKPTWAYVEIWPALKES